MSIRRGETVVDTLYIGLQKRQHPLPGQKEPEGNVYSITKDKITVYGMPICTLTAGVTYNLVIDCPGNPFYITTDVQGGGVLRTPIQSMAGAIEIVAENTAEKGNVGIEKGTLTWTPSRDHSQMKLWYQCNYYTNMGNQIVVNLP